MTKQPDRWYFSFRSPYSWLAYRDLSRMRGDLLESLEWRPFFEPGPQLRSALKDRGRAIPYVPMSKEKHLYILQDVHRLAAERGLVNVWPLDNCPCWETSHLAWFVAADAGRSRDYVDAIYEARWERSENISDPQTIRRVGERIGLNPEALAGAASDPEMQARGLAALMAVCDDQVFGVPMFITGRDRYWGLDRVQAFAAVVDVASGKASTAGAVPEVGDTPAVVGGGVTDLGPAGGCG